MYQSRTRILQNTLLVKNYVVIGVLGDQVTTQEPESLQMRLLYSEELTILGFLQIKLLVKNWIP